MGVEVETAEVSNKTVTLSGTFKDNKSLLKAVKKVAETDDYKIVQVVNTEIEEKLYGMTEQLFLENAEVLPPRTAEDEVEE